MISKKVVLTGPLGVGKTSLFNRFLYQRFSKEYLSTIGAKIDKKVLDIEGRALTLMVWDIAGEVAQKQVPLSYFLGASGIIYVFDLSRPATFLNMKQDLDYLRQILPGVCLKVVGNKTDLLEPEALAEVLNQIPHPPDVLTSAKTGENVETLFQDLGRALLDTSLPS